MKIENNENIKDVKTALAMIAHDLKTPILAQHKIIEQLLEGFWGNITAAQKEVLELMFLSSNYSQNLVKDIMDVYKYEHSQVKLNLIKFNFSTLIKDCKDMMRLLFGQKGIKVNLQTPMSCFVFADEVMIKRAVMNIITNAINYSKKNTSINIILEVRENTVIFSVQNEGSYISNEILSNVFKKGYTALNTPISASAGLGLYFVENVINAHRGKVFAKSFECGTNIFGFILKENYISG